MKQTHITYGFITALVMIIAGVILYISNLSFESWSQYVSYAIFLVGIILNANAFSKANDADVTFGKVFSSGFKASAIVTLATIAWSFISLMIFPDIMEKGMEMARAKMEERGLGQDMIDQQMEMTRKYFKAFMVGGILFMYMFVGALFSLIGAAIAKKNPRPQAPTQLQ